FIKENLFRHYISTKAFNGRIIHLIFAFKKLFVNIFAIYAPATDNNDTKRIFFNDLTTKLQALFSKSLKVNHILIARDWNISLEKKYPSNSAPKNFFNFCKSQKLFDLAKTLNPSPEFTYVSRSHKGLTSRIDLIFGSELF